MKTLAEFRDELAEHYKYSFFSPSRGPSEMIIPGVGLTEIDKHFAAGFDSGAKAVMENAQKLVEALFYAHSTYHSAHAAFLGSCGICSALKEWQEFVGIQK